MSLTRIKVDSIANGEIGIRELSAELSATFPIITNIQITDNSYNLSDKTVVELDGGHIKIQGSHFISGCRVLVDSEQATTTEFVSASEVNANLPAMPAGSYHVYLVNPGGSFGIKVGGITYSPIPAWQTEEVLANALASRAYSVQLGATDAITYALAAGSSLPPGLSLSSSGLLSGTVTGITDTTTYSFTVVATDAESQTSTRSFSLPVSPLPPPLFEFTSFTFNTGGQSVRYGPSLSTLRAYSPYSTASWASNNSFFNMSITGVQQWTVPVTGNYRLIVAGARGGAYNSNLTNGSINGGGRGAIITTDVSLNQNDILHIVCGQYGGTYSGQQCGGGGGGSFVSKGDTYTTSILLVAAGGGGGGGSSGSVSDMDAQISTTGGGLYAGSNGLGGGSLTGSSEGGSGGGGWLSGGGVVSGNQPGLQIRSGTSPTGAQSVYGDSSNSGGFAGGAAGWGAPGGGGGYSGGGALTVTGGSRSAGGGGGSYSVNTPISTSVTNYGNGYVTITLLG